VTTHKGLETLAMRELQILHSTVPVNESEGVELALVAFGSRAIRSVPSQPRSVRPALAPYGRKLVAASAAGVLHARTGGECCCPPGHSPASRVAAQITAALAEGSFSSNSAMVALYGSSLLGPGRPAGVWAGISRYFLIVSQPMRRWRSILRIGQCSGPIQAMQVVDLFGRQHGSILIYKGRIAVGTRTLFLVQDSGEDG